MFKKSLLLMLLMALMAPWAAKAQTTGCEAIGESSTSYGASGSNGAGYVPVDTYYNYSYEQMVYDGSEMPTTITSISFKYKSSYSMTEKDNVDIYLGETTTATLSSWMPASDLTLVYSGALDFPASTDGSWVEFTFNQNGGSFSHDQSKYIVVVINDKSEDYPTSYGSMYFCYQACASGAHKYRRNDYNEYTVPPTDDPLNASQCPIVRFCGTFPVICCPKPKDLACTGYTATTATFTWTNGGEETQWLLEYAMDENFTNPTQVTVNQSDLVNGAYTLDNNLTTDQQYYARIKAYCPSCDPNYSDWSNTCAFKPSNTHYAVIGTGATASSGGCYGGIYTWNNHYAYTQQLYTANELTTAGAIPGVMREIALKFAESTDCKLTFEVYLGQTTGTSLSSAWISDANLTKVYAGETTFSGEGEWNSIDVTTITEWDWDGTSNIVVAIRRTDKTPPAISYPDFYYTSATNMCRYYSDSSNSISLNDFNVPSETGSTTAQRVDMQFGIAPNPTPKPTNLHIVDNSLSSSGATLAWVAPTTATPTSYQYQYKPEGGEWSALQSTTNLSVALSLSASTPYTFQVRAAYDGVGESAFVETTFTTLDNCAFPTNFAVSTTPGQGTKATFTWTKGYDEEAWVLQYATNDAFTENLREKTTGFTTSGNTVTYNANDLIAETHFYARVKANCGGPTSSWSDVVEFTPTNYVDYTFNEDATSNSSYSYIPFRGGYVAYQTNSQFIIPATSLGDVAGGTVRKLTFYSNTTTVDWGEATFKVYVAEVDNTTFASNPTSFDWSAMDEVYSGSLSVANGKMEILLDQAFPYSGTKNLMIGFEKTAVGTNATVAWIYKSASNTCAYSYNSSSATGPLTYNRSGYLPKVTFNYLPTTTPRPIITEPVTTTEETATIAWTKPSDNVTGYKYQYKLAADAWTDDWTTLNDANAVSVTIPGLTPNSSYNFRIKAVYAAGESAISSTNFATECPAATAVPYSYGFETAPEFNCWEVTSSVSDGVKRANSYAHEGSYSLVFYGTQLNEIEMPLFNQPTNTLRLEYWVRPEGYTDSRSGSFAIGYYNANDEFVALKTYTFNTTTGQYDDWESTTYIKQRVEFDVDANNDGTPDVPADAHIVFRQFDPTSNYYWMIDDVKVKVIPACDDVENPVCTTTTAHTATLSWTVLDNTQENWQVAYSEDVAFNPNSVTPVDVNTNPATIGELAANKTYYAYVRGNCGGTPGDWSDTYATIITPIGNPAPTAFHTTDIQQEQVTLDWTNGGGDNETSWVVLLNSENIANINDLTDEQLAAQVETTGRFYNIDSHPNNIEPLTPGTTYYAWVRANCGTDGMSAWTAIEGGYFETTPTCPAPTALAVSDETPHGATFSWTNGTAAQDAWHLYISKENTAPDDDIELDKVVAVTANPFTMTTGLDPETDYYVWVRSNCGIGDYSEWVGPETFTTGIACPAPTGLAASEVTNHTAKLSWTGTSESYVLSVGTYDYTGTPVLGTVLEEDFEDGLMQGWTTISNDGDANAWTVESTTGYAHLGTKFARSRYTSSSLGVAPDDWLISPQIPFGGKFSFYARRYSTTYTDQFRVYVSTTGNNISDFTAISEVITPKATYELYEYDLSSYSGNGYVAIQYTGLNNQYYVYVDDITITGPVYPIAWETYNTTETQKPVEDLLAETPYFAKVKGNCGSEGYSQETAVISFTTDIACPAPTSLTTTNPKSNSIDLGWTNGGSSDWIVAYKKTTETDFTNVFLNISEVTEDAGHISYTLGGLAAETDYLVKVRDNCEASVTGDGMSEWTTEVPFSTIAACSAMNPVVSDITHHNATVNWEGESASGFTVNYRVAAGDNALFEEGFENGLGSWTFTSMNVVNGIGGSGTYPAGIQSEAAHSDSYSFRFSSYTKKDNGEAYDQYLVSPELTVTGTLKFYAWRYGANDKIYVGYSTTTNDLDAFTWDEESLAFESNSSWKEFTHELPDNVKYIAYHYFGDYAFYAYVDDIAITVPTPAGAWQTEPAATTTADLTGLTAGTKYDLKVVPNCDETLESATVQFTTLAGDMKYFLTAGEWGTAANWMDEEIPAITDNATIRANVTIAKNYVAYAKNITRENSATVTIKDGGELYHNNAVSSATMEKEIAGATTWGTGTTASDGWYVISNPLSYSSFTPTNTTYVTNLAPEAVGGVPQFDLYKYMESSMNWYNYQAHSSDYYLTRGIGFLYSRHDNATISFMSGTYFSLPVADVTPTLTFNEANGDMAGWNLLGNPFSHSITWANIEATNVNTTGYYKLGNDGAWTATGPTTTEPIKPMEGFLVKATAASPSLTMHNNAVPSSKDRANDDFLAFTVANSNYSDITYAMFSEGEGLDKINHRNADIPMVYIPQDGERYAIATMGDDTEMFNLNFKAMTTGEYSLSYKAKGQFDYLHVIDRMTGEDIDMLVEDKYSFIASPRDNENRFIVKLRYNANGNVSTNDIFVYQNDDELIVNGEGELQVYDVMGRYVASYEVNGTRRIGASQFSNAVYIFRLVGNEVKTQKIVVR